jgi:hypothetical protein
VPDLLREQIVAAGRRRRRHRASLAAATDELRSAFLRSREVIGVSEFSRLSGVSRESLHSWLREEEGR